MASFTDQLANLVSQEAAAAKSDADRMGVMIERLAAALGFTIALASHGDGKAIDTFIMGATSYAHEEAVEKSKFAKFMAKLT